MRALKFFLAEPELIAFAARVAVVVWPGDCLALRGDLGAGKTTFARALIRALLHDPVHEVPSPTFALRQDYVSLRGPIVHFDFYRITDPRDVDELGLDEALTTAITIIEWPEQAEALLPRDRLEIVLTETTPGGPRQLVITGRGAAARRIEDLQKPA